MTRTICIATYQYFENYGAHAWDGEGECPQYWKAKGGHEEIVDSHDAAYAWAVAHSNEACSYTLLDVQEIRLDAALLHEVIEHLRAHPEDDLGYARYCFSSGEIAFDWALNKLMLLDRLTDVQGVWTDVGDRRLRYAHGFNWARLT